MKAGLLGLSDINSDNVLAFSKVRPCFRHCGKVISFLSSLLFSLGALPNLAYVDFVFEKTT